MIYPSAIEDTPAQTYFLFTFSHFDTDSMSKKTITNLSNLILVYSVETGWKESWNTLWEWQQFSEKKWDFPGKKKKKESTVKIILKRERERD